MGKNPYLPRCSWNILQPRGLTLPISFRRNNVLQRDIDFSVLIILTDLWKLLRQPEGPFYTTTNILAICLPSFFTSSVSYLRRGFRRTPANHTMRLTWTFKSFRQRECSGFSENLPKWHINSTLSEWLVPTLWSLVLISLAVTSAVYVLTLRFTIAP